MPDVLELLPAVDVRGGRAVQLVGDAAGSSRDFGDPVDAALRWQDAGAPWLHLVDLDAAFGTGDNHELLADIVGRLDIPVQVSGGIVDDAAVERTVATGCRRLVLGTAALRRRGWCEETVGRLGDRLVVGLDVHGGRLSARGSGVDVGTVEEVVPWLERAGAARYVITDVERDGALAGPNLDLVRHVAELTAAPLVACGGIAGLDDIAAVRAAGVEGAIIGSAIYEGRFTVGEALEVAVGV